MPKLNKLLVVHDVYTCGDGCCTEFYCDAWLNDVIVDERFSDVDDVLIHVIRSRGITLLDTFWENIPEDQNIVDYLMSLLPDVELDEQHACHKRNSDFEDEYDIYDDIDQQEEQNDDETA